MARSKSKNQRKTALELAKAGGSRVALAATQQTGGGKHGGSARQNNRRDRTLTKQNLRAIL
jgi:hypothetical protein